MKIGYNQATAMNCSTLQEDLVLCEKNGFDYIEIRDDMLLEYLKTHSVDELKAYFEHHRLKPYSINAVYLSKDMFVSSQRNGTGTNPDSNEKNILMSFLMCCQVAQKIGCEYYIVVPPFEDANDFMVPYSDGEDKIVEDCTRILRAMSSIALRYKIKLAFEPVGNRGCAVKTVDLAWKIIQKVDRDNVGITLDSFNLYLDSQVNDFSSFKQLDPDKIFCVHINNSDDKPMETLNHPDRRFCDSGVIDLDNYLVNLVDIGYQGIVSIETFRDEYYEMSNKNVIKMAYETTAEIVGRYSNE